LNIQITNLSKSNADLSSKIAETDPTKAIELLKKENSLLLDRLNTTNKNNMNQTDNKAKADLLMQSTSQARRDISEYWKNISNNAAGSGSVTKSVSSSQDMLQKNNEGNIKSTNVSNFNPKNPSSSV
jgi:hypothetical protein